MSLAIQLVVGRRAQQDKGAFQTLRSRDVGPKRMNERLLGGGEKSWSSSHTGGRILFTRDRVNLQRGFATVFNSNKLQELVHLPPSPFLFVDAQEAPLFLFVLSFPLSLILVLSLFTAPGHSLVPGQEQASIFTRFSSTRHTRQPRCGQFCSSPRSR